jgi:hypothetical protein
MKKNFIAILAVLIVVDAIALVVWWKNRQNKQSEPAPAVMTPAPAPASAPIEAGAPPVDTGTPGSTASGSTYRSNDGGFGAALFGPGISPGGCATFEACQEYCMRPENEKECLEWTQGDQKKKRTQRESADPMAAAPPGGMYGGMPAENLPPGGCEGPECASYCKKPENQQECMIYCSDPVNRAACKKWGRLTGALKSTVSGSLVSDDAVIEEEAFSVFENQ